MVKGIQGYLLNQPIGQGNFGLVYRATHKQKAGVFAVKVIPIQKFHQNQKLEIYTNNEIEALQAIGISDYIIRFYEMIKSKHNCYLVYQYCNGGTLLNLIRKEQRLEQKRALLIFKQLLEAFKVLNKNSIMHRDLKPENIFFTSVENGDENGGMIMGDRKKVKLGDFGFCKGLKPDQNLAKTMLGSPIYMAPQVLKGESYTTKADIWSLGVILFQMLYGYCPYESKSIASLINTIDTQTVQLPTKYVVSERTQNLIRRMLTKDYFRRIGWVELFNIRIDDNGEYVEEVSMTASEDRSNTPSKKGFGSLFGSLSIGTGSLLPGNRSYSTIRDDEPKQKQQSRYGISKKSIQQPQNAKTLPQPKVSQNRVSSQPKDQKRFYSQNYMNILSTPLSLKKIEPAQSINNSIEKLKAQIISSYDKQAPTPSQLQKQIQSPPHSSISQQSSHSIVSQASPPSLMAQPCPPSIIIQPSPPSIMVQASTLSSGPTPPSSPPPLVFREERLTSMDNLDLVSKESTNTTNNDGLVSVGANLANSSNIGSMIEPIPFNKYRETIGMASNLSSRFMSDRSIKQMPRHSNSTFVPSPGSPSSTIIQLDTKRQNLLKLHQSITKLLSKCLSHLQSQLQLYKATKQFSDFCTLKDLLQDSYIILKIAQQKIKSITESIKITETSLLDMASIINYQNIQVQKFVIEVRNQLLRLAVELPNVPSGLQLSRVDRVENVNCFRDMIKNRALGQLVDDGF